MRQGSWRLRAGVFLLGRGRQRRLVTKQAILRVAGFSERVSRAVVNETNTLLWYDRRLGDVPFCRRFSRLFYLAFNKSSTVATMFSLGQEEGARRGVGGEGCGFGRRSWQRNVGFYLTILFSSLMYLTRGIGIPTLRGVYGAWSLSTPHIIGFPYC